MVHVVEDGGEHQLPVTDSAIKSVHHHLLLVLLLPLHLDKYRPLLLPPLIALVITSQQSHHWTIVSPEPPSFLANSLDN